MRWQPREGRRGLGCPPGLRAFHAFGVFCLAFDLEGQCSLFTSLQGPRGSCGWEGASAVRVGTEGAECLKKRWLEVEDVEETSGNAAQARGRGTGGCRGC